jgi:hypothetical protein
MHRSSSVRLAVRPVAKHIDGVTDVELAWDDAPYAITHGDRIDPADPRIRVVGAAGHAAARRHSVPTG